MEHEEITRDILGCAFEVINELGAGFLESVYEKALWVALQDAGLSSERQHELEVYFRNHVVGHFYADLFVADTVVVELKAVKSVLPEHRAQLINYLNASGKCVGLLINFGNPKLEYHRCTRNHSTATR